MKHNTLLAAATVCVAALSATISAQERETTDSIHLHHMQEIVVSGVQVGQLAPYAVHRLDKEELQNFARTGHEIPLLLSRTPGIVAWSENGIGTGTTYMLLRGATDSRINVTLDGVPLNSPEDQCVFWANMNSYAALLGSAQIIRGVGTSTNGDGAFGGTVAMTMAAPDDELSGEITGSGGSYGTWHAGGRFSSGLIKNKVILDAAFNHTYTDGYVHGTNGTSGSYYAGLTWMPNRKLSIRYRNVGNYEHTGQAWNGVQAGDDASIMDGSYDDGSWNSYNLSTGIHTYADLVDRGLGRYNPLWEHLVPSNAGTGFYTTDADGKFVTERYTMSDGSLWPRTTDNFRQNHNILSAAWDINQKWSATATAHYTYGYGYYEEFKADVNLPKKFGLNYFKPNGKAMTSDLVRQKGLEQHTFGLMANANYKTDTWDINTGFALQQFKGNHFGRINYLSDATLSATVLSGGRHKYYDSDAWKGDHSLYLKAIYNIDDEWAAMGDIQYRHVGYRTDGVNDKFVKQSDGTYTNHRLDIDKHYHFINPKAGITWHRGGHRAYFSEAISHREPERNNFTDNGSYPAPKAEWVFDYELGYGYRAARWHASANLYAMIYGNQFVKTGAKSDIGEDLTTNIRSSYRLGVELVAGWDITSWLSIEGNAALSHNRIKDFDEVVDDWGDGRTIHYDNSTLAFSPSVILNGFIDFHWRRIQATWHTNFVSRQYLDNTECIDRSLPAFSASDVNIRYTLPFRCKGLKEAIFGATLNNIFNARYAAHGWVYSAILDAYGHGNDNRYYQIGFIPAAPFTAMGSLTLRF